MDTDFVSSMEGTLKTPKDAGKGEEGIVKRWKKEIDLADKREKDWRESAQEAIKIYRAEEKKQNQFNILWSNIEVLRPNLYNSTPRPDARRRYGDKDPVGKQVAEVLERCLSYEIDICDFDDVMKCVVLDMARQGRGVARVGFTPYYDGEGNNKVLTYIKLYVRLVQWDRFKRGPGETWKDIPWIAYEHLLTHDEIKKKFPGFENKVQGDYVVMGAEEEKAVSPEPSIFKRTKVWEIWDKETRTIIWIAPSFPESPLATESDKLKLEGFFDTPRPIYAIDDTTTLDPIVEYDLYKGQARELNRVTARINHILEQIKIRGIYDATINELGTLFKAMEGDLIPTQSATIAMQSGGLDKAIWLMPVEKIALVLKELYLAREQAKMAIYEITGLSDIMRGQSDPNETLGAQELKANNASVRIQSRQRDVQRYARDLLRIMAEIIAEHYTPEMLRLISGIPVTPEMQQILRRDLLRGIRVDIETDSTIAADQAKDRQEVAELLEAFGGLATGLAPVVQTGAMSQESAKALFMSIIRKAKLGREVEEAIEVDKQTPIQTPPDPEMLKLQAEQQSKQAEMQFKQQEMAGKLQAEQAKGQLSLQLEQAKMQAEAQRSQAEMAIKQQELQQQLQLDAAKHQHEAAIEAQKLALEKEKAVAELALKREEMLMNIKLKREEMELNAQLEEKKAKMQIELQAKKDAEAKEAEAEKAESDKNNGANIDLAPIASALEKLGGSSTKISIKSDESGNISGEMTKG